MPHKRPLTNEQKGLEFRKGSDRLPSRTVPHETKTIREILVRHGNGQVSMAGIYQSPIDEGSAGFDDVDLEKHQVADLVDRAETADANRARIKELSEKAKVEAQTRKENASKAKQKDLEQSVKSYLQGKEGAAGAADTRKGPKTEGTKE